MFHNQLSIYLYYFSIHLYLSLIFSIRVNNSPFYSSLHLHSIHESITIHELTSHSNLPHYFSIIYNGFYNNISIHILYYYYIDVQYVYRILNIQIYLYTLIVYSNEVFYFARLILYRSFILV